jgi:hypothetical protein
MLNKYGRKARVFDPSVPHMSSLIFGKKELPSIPDSVDYTKNMPANFGMMLNDRLGDCTCAAFYHARQIWTYNAGHKEVTEPDVDVLKLYEKVGGYKPGNPSTDNGAVEQDVLKYLLRHGAPTKSGKADKILAYFEIDPRNQDDIKRVIYECGIAYIGFEVPSNIMPEGAEPPEVWTVDPKATIDGGHAVILAGYDAEGVIVISWGQIYKMTWEFFATYVDEAYAIIDKAWINSTGKTPLGMTIQELESLVKSII